MSVALAAVVVLLWSTTDLYAQQVGIWDPSFVEARLRSDYSSGVGVAASPLAYAFNGPGLEGCLWNAESSFMACPGRIDAATPPAWRSGWGGQVRPFCGGDSTEQGNSWTGCRAFSTTNAFAFNQPGQRFWVVHANLEPAFDQCQSGPPSQSERVHTGSSGLFRIETTSNQFTLWVDNGAHDFSCLSEASLQEHGVRNVGIPFLSLGAQSNRGNTTMNGTPMPVARFRFFNPQADDVDRLQFSARIPAGVKPTACQDDLCSPGGAHGYYVGLYLLAEWQGTRRMLFFSLDDRSAMAYPVWCDFGCQTWNWPLQQSMFFPGAQVGHIKSSPGIGLDYCALRLPALRPGPLDSSTGLHGAGVERNYDLSIRRLFECAFTLGTLRWDDNQADPDVLVNVLGVHWFVETYGTSGTVGLSIRNPRITSGLPEHLFSNRFEHGSIDRVCGSGLPPQCPTSADHQNLFRPDASARFGLIRQR